MKSIIEFLNSFFNAECEAYLAERKPNIEDYNQKLKILNSFTNSDKVGFNLIYLKEPYSESFYKEDVLYMVPIEKRFLYKIEKYDNQTYAELFRCYLSPANPEDWKVYGNCFFIAKVESEFKIVAQATWDSSNHKWRFVGGDENIKISKLGKPVEVLKIMPPEDDKACLKDFNKT